MADLMGFAKAIMKMTRDACDLDGCEVQDTMVKHGLLVETKFDPEKHVDEYGDAEEGDPWYEVALELRAADPMP